MRLSVLSDYSCSQDESRKWKITSDGKRTFLPSTSSSSLPLTTVPLLTALGSLSRSSLPLFLLTFLYRDSVYREIVPRQSRPFGLLLMEIRQSFISERDNAFPSPPLLSPCTPFGISFNTGKSSPWWKWLQSLGPSFETITLEMSAYVERSSVVKSNLIIRAGSMASRGLQVHRHGPMIGNSMLIQLLRISSLVWYPVLLRWNS